ncbi:MAG: DUF4846 domain-containing protein, partial [Sediminibacterium sp.]
MIAMIVYFTKALLLLFSVYTTESRIPEFDPAMRSVKEIPLPAGFERIPVQGNFFQEYLRNLPLRKDKTIYLYNKRPKFNQSLHYAVIDVSTGEKDLQQCADAIMRLRAEYFYQKGVYDSICFPRNSRSVYQFSQFVKTYPTKKR